VLESTPPVRSEAGLDQLKRRLEVAVTAARRTESTLGLTTLHRWRESALRGFGLPEWLSAIS
jgi:hypothetical protein